jgi:hypothetical protein
MRALLDAEQRGRGLSDVRLASSTTIPTRAHPHDKRSGRADRLGRGALNVPDLGLVVPHNAAGLDAEAHDIAAQAWAAWEAAVCWDDEHSVKRLAEVRAV